jgi:hypothetical protein
VLVQPSQLALLGFIMYIWKWLRADMQARGGAAYLTDNFVVFDTLRTRVYELASACGCDRDRHVRQSSLATLLRLGNPSLARRRVAKTRPRERGRRLDELAEVCDALFASAVEMVESSARDGVGETAYVMSPR